jgi:hypothetical protein
MPHFVHWPVIKWLQIATRTIVCTLLLSVALASDSPTSSQPVDLSAPGIARVTTEFTFVRLAYTDNDGFGRGGRWLTDFPEAEYHLSNGVRRLTRVKTAEEGIRFDLMDDNLFEYPWVYAVEVGSWSLNDKEAARLRDYLLRGGFLMVDDFHGSYEWDVFVQSMRRVFPDRPIVDIPQSHSAFHVVYDLNDRVQIPGIGAHMRGSTYERDGYEPHWRGIYDDEGRLVVAINFNMDLGDAWEHADTPQYPITYTTRAYQYAINYLLYAMTH